MTEPLDNLYLLDENHDQIAYNGLVQLPEIQEELVWTALPKSKKHPKDMVGSLVITPSVLVWYVWLSSSKGISWPMAGLIYGLAALFGIVTLLRSEQLRRENFYGISATTLWVKKHQKPLEQYHIPSLTRLAINNGVLSYSTIQNNEYNKYTLLENVPNIEAVYQLLLQLQLDSQQPN
ncbi:MAG: hypothetical protein AB8E82_10260 [Aureispira sp.]